MIVILIVVIYSSWTPVENFEVEEAKAQSYPDTDEEEEPQTKVSLTETERELFEDLKNNKLTPKEIEKMVDTNQITTRMVDKFLRILNRKEKDGEEDDVEPFCDGGLYASCSA